MHKIYTSNFSLKEQNEKIESKIKTKKEYYIFNNKKLYGRFNNKIGILKEVSKTKKESNFSPPDIIINTSFLKKIFDLLKELELKRTFLINIINNETIEIIDILTSKTITEKVSIIYSNKNSFKIDSEIFSLFYLNHKTITKKSFIYIGKK
jgi:hypothetical protein